MRLLLDSPPQLKSLPDGRHIHQARMFYRDFAHEVGNKLLDRPRVSFQLAQAVSTKKKPARCSPSCTYAPNSSLHSVASSRVSRSSKTAGPSNSPVCASKLGSRAKSANRATSRNHKHVHLSPSGDSAILRPLVPSPPPRRNMFSREDPPKRHSERVFFRAASARMRPLHLLAARADWALEGSVRHMKVPL